MSLNWKSGTTSAKRWLTLRMYLRTGLPRWLLLTRMALPCVTYELYVPAPPTGGPTGYMCCAGGPFCAAGLATLLFVGICGCCGAAGLAGPEYCGLKEVELGRKAWAEGPAAELGADPAFA